MSRSGSIVVLKIREYIQKKVAWLNKRSRFTYRFSKQINRLTAITTDQEAGWYLGLDDEVVYRIDKERLEEQAKEKLTPTPLSDSSQWR